MIVMIWTIYFIVSNAIVVYMQTKDTNVTKITFQINLNLINCHYSVTGICFFHNSFIIYRIIHQIVFNNFDLYIYFY